MVDPELEDFITNRDWDNEPIPPETLIQDLENWVMEPTSARDLVDHIGLEGIMQMAVWILENHYSEV